MIKSCRGGKEKKVTPLLKRKKGVTIAGIEKSLLLLEGGGEKGFFGERKQPQSIIFTFSPEGQNLYPRWEKKKKRGIINASLAHRRKIFWGREKKKGGEQ